MKTKHNWRTVLQGMGHLAPQQPRTSSQLTGDLDAWGNDGHALAGDWLAAGMELDAAATRLVPGR